MTEISKSNLFSYLQITILVLLILGYLCIMPPDVSGGDTPEYMTLYTWRPPVYPIFFWLFQWAGKYQPTAVMWTQSLLCLFTLLYARNWLHKSLGLSGVITFFIMLCTIFQLFFHFHMIQMIYSEGLSFPIFVFSFLLLVESVHTFNIKKIFLLTILINLLVLTRVQFYFFYPILGVLIFWHILKKVPANKIIVCVLFIVSSTVITRMIDLEFHRLYPATATSYGTPKGYLLIHALYVAHSSDVQYLKNNAEKNYFTKTMKELERKQLTKQSAPSILGRPIPLPIENAYYLAVHVQIIHVAYNFVKGMSYKQSETLFWNISKVVLLHHIKESIVFYFWRVVSTIGDISIFFIVLIPTVVAGFRMLTDRNWKPDPTQIFVALSLVTILLDVFSINVFEVSVPRFLFYCFFLAYCLGGILAEKLFLGRRDAL